MSFDINFIINTMYPAATAAYDIMSNPQPSLPPGYALAGALEAAREQAAAAMASATPAQQRAVSAMLSDSHIFGLVAWNAAEHTALVAFRGTKTPAEWLADVDAAPVPYLPVDDAGLVHMGFQLVYEHIRANVAQLLGAKCQGAQRVLVTGHSLGGAVAVLSGFDIARNLHFTKAPELYTFAGPRVGAPDFAASFDAAIPVCCRVVNFMDVVPQVPLPPLYQHVGQELSVNGGFRPLDFTYAHHLTTYLAGLKKKASETQAAGVSRAGV